MNRDGGERWIVLRIVPAQASAVAAAITTCGGRILDGALDKALLFEAAPVTVERLRKAMPGLHIVPEVEL